MKRALLVVSAADHWTLLDGTQHPTGYWAEELAEPHRILTEAGWHIDIATPGGKQPTIDRLSLGLAGGTPGKTRRYKAYLDTLKADLAAPLALSKVDHDDYDLVFYPGGHGPMEDLAVDTDSGALLAARLASGRPLALLCHGPAALLGAVQPDGIWPFAGYTMTALSNREEAFNRFAKKAPWFLETRLVDEGAHYVKGALPLRPYVVVDRNLYTGQNPASAGPLTRRLIADLDDRAQLSVTVSKTIAAPADQLHTIVSDITRMGELSPETHSARWLTKGETFLGSNNIGPFYRWSTKCRIVENRPGRSFAFSVAWPSQTYWRYDFTPVDGGTTVTETMRKIDAQMAPVRWMQSAVGVPDRSAHLRAGMTATLDRLADVVAREPN